MRKRVFAITGASILETRFLTFRFMRDSGAPYREFLDFSSHWGYVQLRERGKAEVDPFKLARGEPGAIGPNGILKWDICIMESGQGQVFTGHVDESEPDEEGFQQLFKDAPDCVLLMDRSIFDRFQRACELLGIELSSHHFDGELSTS